MQFCQNGCVHIHRLAFTYVLLIICDEISRSICQLFTFYVRLLCENRIQQNYFVFQSHIFRITLETPPDFISFRSGIAAIYSQASLSTFGRVQKCLHGFLGATLKPISRNENLQDPLSAVSLWPFKNIQANFIP